MLFKCTISLVLLINGFAVCAQTRLKGDYIADYNTFTCVDLNIIVKPFVNGLAAFMIKGVNPDEWKTNRVGFIDTSGKIIIKPVYANSSDFNHDLALVMDTSGKRAAINRKGQIIIPFAGQEIGCCSNWLYVISQYADISMVDAGGRTIVPFGTYSACESDWQPLYGYYIVEEANDVGGRRSGFVWYPMQFYRLAFDKYITVQSGTGKTAKWGTVNRDGKEIIPPKFDAIGPFINGMAPFSLNNKCGITDTAGNTVIGPKYDNIALSDSGFAIAMQNKKSGVVSLKNRIIIPFEYDRIRATEAGGFLVDTIMPLKYDLVKPFRDGLGAVMVNKKWGLVNNKGIEIAPCRYDEVVAGPLIRVCDNKLYGLINRDGKVIMPTVCSSITLGWRVHRPIYILTRHGKTGMIDATSGKLFLPFIYDSASSLTYFLKPQGKLLVKNKGLVGVADSTGKIIVPALYTSVSIMNDTSKNRYWIFRNTKRGVAAEDGRVILPPVYDNVMPFDYSLPGLYKITQDRKEGIADDHGKIIIPCKYTYLSGFGHHPLVVGKGQLFGVMDWKQRTIVPFVYQSVAQSHSGYIVRLNDKVGVLDLKGNPIIPITYNYISGYMIKNTYFLTKDNKMGVADNTGKIILPVVYDNMEPCGSENIVVTKDKLYGMIDYKGKVIYPCTYKLIKCVDGKVVEIY